MNPFTHIGRLIRHSATGPVRLPAPLSWRMLTRDPAAAVQRAILMEYLKTGSTTSRLLDLGIALMFWPFRTFAQAMRLTRQVGGQVTHIRSRPAQFFQQIWLALFHGISPYMSYQAGIISSAAPVRPMQWLQNGHAGLLSRIFKDDKSLPEINDKVLFAEIIAAAGVSTPSTLAVFEAGRLVSGLGEADFIREVAKHDGLFVKPVQSSGGKGAIMLLRQENREWRLMASALGSPAFQRITQTLLHQEYGSPALWNVLGTLSNTGRLVVQPRLRNHPGLPALGGPALMAVRVLSGLGENGVVLLRAVLRLPFSSSVASQHGVDALVDLDTGRLGQVFIDSLDQRFHRAMPPTGPVIEGAILPFWRESLDMVKKAHSALPSYPFLGWDVAITPSGPVALEANGNYGLAGLQKPGPAPLIDEQFLSVFDYWSTKMDNLAFKTVSQ